MINIIAAATIALSAPTDTTEFDWVDIISNWEWNLTDSEVNTINSFLDSSVDKTWTETVEGWEELYYTNKQFDTVVVESVDTVGDRYFDLMYWTEVTQNTTESIPVELFETYPSLHCTSEEFNFFIKWIGESDSSTTKGISTSFYKNDSDTVLLVQSIKYGSEQFYTLILDNK